VKSNLNLLIIINIITAILSFLIGGPILASLSIINIIVFAVLSSKDEKTFLANKNTVLLFSILNFMSLRIVTGVLCTSLYSNMKKLREYYFYNNLEVGSQSERNDLKPKVDPQIKKVDILLKLGVGMVFIAGLVFATTGWNTLHSIFKILILMTISFMFIGLSKFCERKIKIVSTIYLYWILGMAFTMFMIFTIGYSDLLGNYFCFSGAGRLLYFAFCTLVVSILCICSYFNFSNKYFLIFTYIGILFSIIFTTNHFLLSSELIILMLTIVATFINFLSIDKERDLYTLILFSKIMLIVLGISFALMSGNYINTVITGLSCLLFILNLFKFVLYNKNSDFNYLIPFCIYIVLLPLFQILLHGITTWTIVTSAMLTTLYFISIVLKGKKFELSSLITANIANILSFLTALFGPVWLPMIVLIFTILLSVFNSFKKTEYFMYEYNIQPLKVSMIILSLFHLFKDNFTAQNIVMYWFLLSILMFILIYILLNNKNKILVYERYILVSSIISFFSISQSSNIVISIVSFLAIIIFYLENSYKNIDNICRKNLIFWLLIFNLFIGIHVNVANLMKMLFINWNPSYFSNIIILVLFVVLGMLYRKEKNKFNIVSFGIILPMLSFGFSLSYEWALLILISIIFYYLTFNMIRLAKLESIKELIGYIGFSVSFVFVIFNSNYIVLCYSCLILLLSLGLGYIVKKYNSLFKSSIVFIIIFVIYQLKEFWTKIPAWIYLLIVGLTLIIFATYKQLKIIDQEHKIGKEGK